MRSEYRRLATAVTHRGVWIIPSVADVTSLKPCERAWVNIGFFFWVVQRQSELGKKMNL
jgi:hypothetical protein